MLSTTIKNLHLSEQAEKDIEASGFIGKNTAFSEYCQDISVMNEFALAEKLTEYSALTGKRVQGFSEIHIAAYYAELFAGFIYFVPEYNQFYFMQNGRYVPDTKQRATLAMKALVLSCIALSDSFSKFLTSAKISSCLELAKSCTEIQRSADDFDKCGTILNTPNGCFDLRTGQPAEYQPSMIQTGVSPEFDNETPVWDMFLSGITKGDSRLAEYIASRFAYSLVYGNSEQTFTLCHGSGANGKGVLLGLMQHIFGSYAVSIQPEMLTIDKNGQARPSPEMLQLRNRRLIICSETSQGMALNLQRIKALTGGDKVSARPLFSNMVSEFPVGGQIVIQTNHLPALNTVDFAIKRRVRLIPFNAIFDEKTRDEKMLQKLKAEAPAILGKLIRVASMYLETGRLPECEAVSIASNQYIASEDKITAFLDSCTRINSTGKASSKELFAKYLYWCEEAGEQSVSQNKFGRTLTEKGFLISSDRRYRLGLELCDSPQSITTVQQSTETEQSENPMPSATCEIIQAEESESSQPEVEQSEEEKSNTSTFAPAGITRDESSRPQKHDEPIVSRRCVNCVKVRSCKQSAGLRGAGCEYFSTEEENIRSDTTRTLESYLEAMMPVQTKTAPISQLVDEVMAEREKAQNDIEQFF